jgi:3',5'-cyclic AMP phosphodiesterase CpdA
MLIIGLNSIAPYSKYRNPLASNGRISAEQHEMIKRTLSLNQFRNKIKIALVHHHFMPKLIYHEQQRHGLWNLIEHHSMKLYGKHKLVKTFARHKFNLVLHGHVHENNRYQRKGIPFVNGGAAIDDGKRQNLSINFININSNGIRIDTEKILCDDLIYQEFPVVSDLIPQLAG